MSGQGRMYPCLEITTTLNGVVDPRSLGVLQIEGKITSTVVVVSKILADPCLEIETKLNGVQVHH